MNCGRIYAAAVAWALLGSSTPALGQQPSAPAVRQQPSAPAAAGQQSSGSAAANNRAAAEQLFVRGRELMAAGKYREACAKLEESQRLDPAPGTLLNLASCYDKGGQTASAWAAYKQAASAAEVAGRRAWAVQARTRAQQLEPKLARLTVVGPPPPRVPGLSVLRDGVPLGQQEWGEPIPLDPGEHVVEATAPGHVAWRQTVSLSNSDETVTIPPLAKEPTLSPAAAGTAASAQPTQVGETTKNSPRKPVHKQWWFWTGAGAIVAGIATVFVVSSLEKDTPCPAEAMGRCQ